jgi:hypothetical protein
VKIAVDTFAGTVPQLSARLLQTPQAQKAANARLDSGDLRPWNGFSKTRALKQSGAKTIYLYKNAYWFEFSDVVDVVRAPVADDTYGRAYYTGTDKPRVTDNDLALTGSGAYPIASYQLGLPAPASGPAVSVQGSVTDNDPSLVESRAYVYTFVSKYGEEGPPSAASGLVDWAPGQDVVVSGFAVPSGEYVLDTIRIYRTNTSAAGAEYQYVGEVATSSSSYTDSVADTALGEVLASEGWVAPPDDMHSLVTMPGGMLAGARGFDVLISEAYQPHAWPYAYRLSVDDTIVGLGVEGNTLVVLTERRPYFVAGSTPASMSMAAAASAEFACASKRSIAGLPGGGVVYAAPGGLAAITESRAEMLTREYLTPEQWRAYNPDTMVGLVYHGRYFGFYDGGCLVFDPASGHLSTLDLTADGGYRDPASGKLYAIKDGEIQQWNDGDALTYTWRSKVFELPRPVMWSAARVRGDKDKFTTLTIKLYADGSKVATLRPVHDQAFRLPVATRSKRWEVELTGTDTVQTVELAERLAELSG